MFTAVALAYEKNLSVSILMWLAERYVLPNVIE
jgi:hypothetical protein